jgi:hypothetical protein
VDHGLGRFLNAVRPRARRAHLAVYEDVAASLDSFLRRRRRSLRTTRASELRGFLAWWALRRQPLVTSRDARRFCAAVRVLSRWLDRERGGRRGLRDDVARAARDVARAARVSALLDDAPSPHGDGGRGRAGYWQVALRGDAHVVLRDLRGGDLLGPVPMSPSIVRALPSGAVLGLRLRADGRRWAVVAHGACYPAEAAPALRGDHAGRA